MPPVTYTKPELKRLVADAYQYLYDWAHLRTHTLTELLIPDAALDGKQKAEQLYTLLIGVLDELDPGPRTPVFSREWRRHRLMIVRYVDSKDIESVLDELAISKRQYYREHDAAMDAVVSILWERCLPQSQAQPASQDTAQNSDYLGLLRHEAALAGQIEGHSDVHEVLNGVVALLTTVLYKHLVVVEVNIPTDLPLVGLSKQVLRQLLLNMIGVLAEWADKSTLQVAADADESAVHLHLIVPAAALLALQEGDPLRMATIQELAVVNNLRLLIPPIPLSPQTATADITLQLPISHERTILIIDDNADILELFQRYLHPHHYRVVTAQTGREALNLARQLQPWAITLDLMMPEIDGWELLQILQNQPETQHIPLIVCSVLRQKDLALALGAAAFLEKPLSEQALLVVLNTLEAV